MKSIKDLAEIKKNTLTNVNLQKDRKNARIVVGLATCGIAAGAKPVLAAFFEEMKKRKLSEVTVSQTGCIGVCRLEPMVEVYLPNQEKVTYVKVTEDMVPRIVAEHIVNGNPVQEYTIGYFEANNNN